VVVCRALSLCWCGFLCACPCIRDCFLCSSLLSVCAKHNCRGYPAMQPLVFVCPGSCLLRVSTASIPCPCLSYYPLSPGRARVSCCCAVFVAVLIRLTVCLSWPTLCSGVLSSFMLVTVYVCAGIWFCLEGVVCCHFCYLAGPILCDARSPRLVRSRVCLDCMRVPLPRRIFVSSHLPRVLCFRL
jgi:hypothetical protein